MPRSEALGKRLVDLTGLAALEAIESLRVMDNSAMVSLDSLPSLRSVLRLDSLPSCEVDAFVERLDGPRSRVHEENNGTGACSP
ncbi:hypothetical protein WME91_33370 [Sorangium sp. So ce269]